jgi:UDP-N-acetyl-D-galactosamine dehydrogenase
VNNTLYYQLLHKEAKLAVIGLGYVGLPIALEFAKFFSVIGFDINAARIDLMRQGIDPSRELEKEAFLNCDILFTHTPDDLKNAQFYIVAVPTPVDEHSVPNLEPLKSASQTLGRVLKPGDYFVYESTVYPGCTEEDCLPILEQISGLKHGRDFKIGYSPERINPGDKDHTLTKITKVVSGCDEEALNTIAQVYEHIITAGVFKASSIKVAEAAKVIENTQRDLNIALMNELALIFDRMGISTHDVLAASSTKWNFLRFYPGLVGGHCIGVDPYYLTHKSNQLGYRPQVILSGRSVNDEMSSFIAKKAVQFILRVGKNLSQSKVLVMGITFKENVSDIRNTKVTDLIKELQSFSVQVDITDPFADSADVYHEYDLEMVGQPKGSYDCIIIAVQHEQYLNLEEAYFQSISDKNGIIIDIKGIYKGKINELKYWTL